LGQLPDFFSLVKDRLRRRVGFWQRVGFVKVVPEQLGALDPVKILGF
jgi:hypothetical protein